MNVDSITCTFPNGDTYDTVGELAVLATRRILGTLTPHEAEAIQLFSTEGKGRELTDEQVAPPGSQLYAITRDLQAELKTKLRAALANVVPCKDESTCPLIAQEGDVVRLTAVNGQRPILQLHRSLQTFPRRRSLLRHSGLLLVVTRA